MTGGLPQDELPPDELKWRARDLALRRLAAREYSALEMRQYLVRKGVEEALAREVVDELVADGTLSDKRYAGALARDQFIRDKGPMLILRKLRAKGVSVGPSEARQIYDEVSEEGELVAIQAILERRYPDARNDPGQRRRAYQALVRRGFSMEAIQRCLGMVLSRD